MANNDKSSPSKPKKLSGKDILSQTRRAISQYENQIEEEEVVQSDKLLSSLKAEQIIGKARLDALGELSQKQINRKLNLVVKEETELEKSLSLAYQNKDQLVRTTVESYTQKLTELYWNSTKLSVATLTDNNSPLKKEYPQILKILRNAIENEPIFNESDENKTNFQKPLLVYADKIKEQLEKRTSLGSRLKKTALSIGKTPLAEAMLSGVAAKSPLFALGMWALKKPTKTSDYKTQQNAQQEEYNIKLEQAKRQKQISARKTEQSNIEPTIASADTNAEEILGAATSQNIVSSDNITLEGTPSASRAERRRAAKSVWAASDGMKKSVSIGEPTQFGNITIEKILQNHTELLNKIYTVNNKQLEFNIKNVSSQTAATEEKTLESGYISSDTTATKEIDTANKKGSFGGLLKNIKEISVSGSELMSAMKLLSNPLLIAGAAFAGWEIGKMIDKWTGASEYVAKAASWFSEKLGLAPKAAKATSEGENYSKKIAQERSKGSVHSKAEDWTIEEANTFNKKWNDEQKNLPAPSATGAPSSPKMEEGISSLEAGSLAKQEAPVTQGTPPPSASPEPKIQGTPPPTASPEPKIQGTPPSQTATTPKKPSLLKRLGKAITGGLSAVKNMIIGHEGVKYKPYKDSLGLWTVGVGHLIGNGKTLPPEMDRTFSHEEVMTMFDEDFKKHKKQAETIPGYGGLNETGKAALIDLTFNMGLGNIKKFKKATAALAKGDVETAANEFENSRWYTQVGSRGPEIVSMLRAGKDGAPTASPLSGSQPSAESNDLSTVATNNTSATPTDSTNSPNSVLNNSTPASSTPSGDVASNGRTQLTRNLTPPSGGSGGNVNVTNIQGGTSIISGGGGGASPQTPLPAPVDLNLYQPYTRSQLA